MADKIKNDNNLLYNQFTIKIVDCGVGISEEGIKNLFINFSKLQEN